MEKRMGIVEVFALLLLGLSPLVVAKPPQSMVPEIEVVERIDPQVARTLLAERPQNPKTKIGA
ncbi:hypothetical protein [Pseudomonas indica]|uniref:hypothetical protein n=1 Tax=Pseudomonas indica TaxID=137658 RepID=UPI003FD5CDE8